jgi:hypothetical protein
MVLHFCISVATNALRLLRRHDERLEGHAGEAADVVGLGEDFGGGGAEAGLDGFWGLGGDGDGPP